MSRTLHLFGTDWCAMMVPIHVLQWYRMQCYDGTDSCATVVPIRRYSQVKATDKADAVTKAIDSFIAKVRDIKFKAKVDDADIEKLTNDRKKLIENESKLLEDHRKANKEILTRHFYDMSNMMSRNEGVWLSKGWVKTLFWIFLPSMLHTIFLIVYFVTSYIER